MASKRACVVLFAVIFTARVFSGPEYAGSPSESQLRSLLEAERRAHAATTAKLSQALLELERLKAPVPRALTPDFQSRCVPAVLSATASDPLHVAESTLVLSSESTLESTRVASESMRAVSSEATRQTAGAVSSESTRATAHAVSRDSTPEATRPGGSTRTAAVEPSQAAPEPVDSTQRAIDSEMTRMSTTEATQRAHSAAASTTETARTSETNITEGSPKSTPTTSAMSNSGGHTTKATQTANTEGSPKSTPTTAATSNSGGHTIEATQTANTEGSPKSTPTTAAMSNSGGQVFNASTPNHLLPEFKATLPELVSSAFPFLDFFVQVDDVVSVAEAEDIIQRKVIPPTVSARVHAQMVDVIRQHTGLNTTVRLTRLLQDTKAGGVGWHYDGARLPSIGQAVAAKPPPRESVLVNNHMAWCNFTVDILLTDPSAFDGGELLVEHPNGTVTTHKHHHRLHALVFSSYRSHVHMITESSRNARAVWVMFLTALGS